MNILLELLVLFAPLAGCAALFLPFLSKGRRAVSWVSLTAMGLSLSAALALFYLVRPESLPFQTDWQWMNLGPFGRLWFGVVLDRFSLIMSLAVCGVSFCVFLYATDYMKDDPDFCRFFRCLLFFVFSMNGIVLSDNFVTLFFFWELVAVSSYFLIGFWHQKDSASLAANKAFLVNRLADLGFLTGIVYLWALSFRGSPDGPTLLFSELQLRLGAALNSGLIRPQEMTLACLLIFCGVVGKSAQFPLHIWLPDAMEGPTPVSALIHAATMVAAGVYLLSHTFFLFALSGTALTVIAWVGALTLLTGALLACVQTDLKRILAYSTMSQLGYMVLALGLGSATSDLYHLITHAFFKALLFLSAGVLIHAVHTQDIRRMGGLWRKVPAGSLAFLIGAVALCGIPPFSGFFSKDEILALAWRKNTPLYLLAIFGALLSAFYMTRTWWIAIMGRTGRSEVRTGRLSVRLLLPLAILSFFAIGAGFLEIPEFLAGGYAAEMDLNAQVAFMSLAAVFLGIVAGSVLYSKKDAQTEPLQKILGPLYGWIENKFYLDDFFRKAADLFQRGAAAVFDWNDQKVIIAGMVNGTAAVLANAGALLRRIQTGAVQISQACLVTGVLLLLWITLWVRS